MTKTKFGISVGLLGAIAYLCGYLNFLSALVFLIFALVWVQETEVKKNAAQSIILSFFFVIVTTILNYISSGWSWVISKVYDSSYDVGTFLMNFNILPGFIKLVNIAEFVIFVIFFFVALKGAVVKIPCITKMIEKHFPEGK